jgi:DNA modification methylase
MAIRRPCTLETSGERLISSEFLRKANLSDILKLWKEVDTTDRYNYERHIELCQKLDDLKKLPRTYMAIPPQANSDEIWSDISRVNTLNSTQSRKKLTKHLCPLQLDLIRRCVERWSNPGEEVADPFNGIGSVTSEAVKMGRFGYGTELKPEYFEDSVRHTRAAESKKLNALTLFDIF